MPLFSGTPARGVALACLVLAACSDAPPPPRPDAAPPPPGGLVLTDDGLGGLGADTPFELDAVRQAVGHGVTAEFAPGTGAGDPEGTLWLLRDGLLLAEVVREAGREGPARVEVTGEGIPGPGGAEVGQAFSETGLARRDCGVGTGRHAGSAVCEAGGVELVFAHGGDPLDLPPAEALADAILTRMVWRAR